MFVAFKAHIYILFSEGDSFNVRRNLVTKLLKMYISCLKHRCRFELTLHCLHPTHTPKPPPLPSTPPTHPASHYNNCHRQVFCGVFKIAANQNI